MTCVTWLVYLFVTEGMEYVCVLSLSLSLCPCGALVSFLGRKASWRAKGLQHFPLGENAAWVYLFALFRLNRLGISMPAKESVVWRPRMEGHPRLRMLPWVSRISIQMSSEWLQQLLPFLDYYCHQLDTIKFQKAKKGSEVVFSIRKSQTWLSTSLQYL